MRRTHTRPSPARPSRLLLAAALLGLLGGGLAPTAALADDAAPTPAETASPAPVETAEPTATPEPDETPVPQETAAPDETPAPEETADPDGDATERADEGYPSPLDGDYAGSATVHEADPGNYSATREGEMIDWSLSGYSDGNIISDAVLYTSGTMSVSQIQSFLNGKVSRCDPNYTCLKDFRQSTTTQPANSYCTNTYQGGTNETAAQIISKAAKACNVSEKVLLVMLQKEQGLITHTWPSQFRYDKAMGFACPDTGPGNSANCDPKYSGFGYQMYMAAYQLQRYTKDSYFSWFPVGRTSQIQYHPNASCGTKSVHIENNATAALYYYTPYVPNRAALNAGYGTGDSCSAYGNRNFYNYYTDWFGSTRTPGGPAGALPDVSGATGATYRELGGADGRLGDPVSEKWCGMANGGCLQKFEGGRIYWTEKTGARAIWGDFLDRWQDFGAWEGVYGMPTSNPWCGMANGGCLQKFEGGRIYWTSWAGAQPIRDTFLDAWQSQGAWEGPLGMPTSERLCGLPEGGCYQKFTGGGKIYWTAATGAHATRGGIGTAYAAQGNERGSLGYPTSDQWCGLADGACLQKFQNGRIYWSSATGAHPVSGPVFDRWQGLGAWEHRLGLPTSSEWCGLANGGCLQKFEGGRIYHSAATGAFPVWGSIATKWDDLGAWDARLGMPTSTERCGLPGNGCYQSFEGGRIYWKQDIGAHPIWGATLTTWREQGAEHGPLGYPISTESWRDDGRAHQWFEGGKITYNRAEGGVIHRLS